MEVAHFSLLFETVTAPVAPETDMPEPATIDVTPLLVRAPDTRDSPVPSRLLNEEPLTLRLVVEAFRKDE